MSGHSKIVRSGFIMKLMGFWLVYQANCTSYYAKGLCLVLMHRTQDPSCLTMKCPAGKGLVEVKILNVSLWVSLALTLRGRALWAPTG